MPTLLLTSDDGPAAPGLFALVEALQGDYDLRLCLPEREWSACGHFVNLVQPLTVERRELRAGLAAQVTNGSPADCVKLATTTLWPGEIALAVAGINRGANTGVNVLYSGTVAAAMEAAINGVPALAVSLDVLGGGIQNHPPQERYANAARWSAELIRKVLAARLPPWSILNVNIPEGESRGFRLTRHGHSGFREYYLQEADGRYRVAGDMCYRDSDSSEDSVALSRGYISVTPLTLAFSSPDWDNPAWKEFLP